MTAPLSEQTATPEIVVVDYHKGNIRSVERALAAVGADVAVSDAPDAIRSADAVVLPGVGAFTDAMCTLDELGLSQALRDAIGAGTPFLGICLGLHLLYEGGVEHAEAGAHTPGLGVLPGIVGPMPAHDGSGALYKIPHVGWNRVCAVDGAVDGGLFEGIDDGEFFYFTHSFIAPDSDATIATTTHSVEFPCAVHRGNVYGVQFHPEKSSDAGMALIGNFVTMVREA